VSPAATTVFVAVAARQPQDHKDVIDRFGRYPHRNQALGREHSAEEAAWLADYENMPAWAKSQQMTSK
jgi:uncharacterized protein (DUF924 family)